MLVGGYNAVDHNYVVWRVLACPVRVLRIRMTRDWIGNYGATCKPRFTWKMAVKWCVCACGIVSVDTVYECDLGHRVISTSL